MSVAVGASSQCRRCLPSPWAAPPNPCRVVFIRAQCVPMLPTLLAQALAVDMATSFTLAVVILLVGLGVAWGTLQSQVSSMKEKLAKAEARIEEREKHAGTVETRLASMDTTMRRIDHNVEELLDRRRAAASS